MTQKLQVWLAMGLLLISIQAFSQQVVIVEPDQGLNIGALNQAIDGGDKSGNTIFELRRGGLYLLNGAISHTGYKLHIRAEAGTGPLPVLQPAVDQLGESQNHFNPGGSLTLEGLYIQGRGELGAIANRPIVVGGDSSRIIIDNCFIDYTEQAVVRLNSSYNDVYITNSIIRNSLRPENPSNGRVIDTRSNPQDTVLIENSTIYNNGATIIRLGGGFMNYYCINHNTIYKVEFNGGVDIDVALKAKVTNNIFYNFGYRANTSLHDALWVIDSMYNYGAYTDADREFDFKNNCFFIDSQIGDVIDQYAPDTLYRFAEDDTLELNPIHYKYKLRTDLFANDSLLNLPSFDQPVPSVLNFIANGQVDTSNIFRESLNFDNPPPLNLPYWQFFTENNYQIRDLNPPNPYADEDPNVLGVVTTGAYTFNYNGDSRSATAAEGGMPLGDPRWTPYTISLEEFNQNKNRVMVYPNPFNNNLFFEFEAENPSTVTVTIVDVVGREIFNQSVDATNGNNKIQLNLAPIKESGIYFYEVETQTNEGSMILGSGKLIRE